MNPQLALKNPPRWLTRNLVGVKRADSCQDSLRRSLVMRSGDVDSAHQGLQHG